MYWRRFSSFVECFVTMRYVCNVRRTGAGESILRESRRPFFDLSFLRCFFYSLFRMQSIRRHDVLRLNANGSGFKVVSVDLVNLISLSVKTRVQNAKAERSTFFVSQTFSWEIQLPCQRIKFLFTHAHTHTNQRHLFISLLFLFLFEYVRTFRGRSVFSNSGFSNFSNSGRS